MDEHLAVVRRFEEELEKERAARHQQLEELKRWVSLATQAPFQAMAQLKIYTDDKIESVVDSMQACHNGLDLFSTRLETVRRVTVEHENKLELLKSERDRRSRPPTPVIATTPKVPISKLLIRSENRVAEPLTVRVVLVPSRWQQFAFEYKSAPYRRCQSRSLQQDICLSDTSSHAFLRAVERGFGFITRGRPWMPLLCFRSSDKSLGQLPPDKRNRDTWDYVFLEEHCLASDKTHSNVLYIALQHEDLNWHEIRAMPAARDPDEMCWAYDETLDGPINWPLPAAVPAATSALGSDANKLDLRTMYRYSPPPYSSRVSTRSSHPPTPLDVLATSASLLSPISLHPYQQQTNHMHSTHDETNPPTHDTMQPQPSVEAETSGDEHRVKKPKLRTNESESNVHTASASGPCHQHHQQAQARVFYSGRTKGKTTVSGKSKERVRWNVDELRNPMFGLLLRRQ